MITCNVEIEGSRLNKEHYKSLHLGSSAYFQAVVTTETRNSTKHRKAPDIKQQLDTAVLKPSMIKLLAIYKV